MVPDLTALADTLGDVLHQHRERGKVGLFSKRLNPTALSSSMTSIEGEVDFFNVTVVVIYTIVFTDHVR